MALKVVLFPLDTVAPVIPVTLGSVDLFIENPDKLADEIRRHQLMPVPAWVERTSWFERRSRTGSQRLMALSG